MSQHLFLSVFVVALASTGAAALDCANVARPREALDCALENHPDVRESRAALAEAQALSPLARQLVNPELTSQGVAGGSGDRKFTYLELNFAHTFELGGKRPARAERAQAAESRAAAALLAARERVFAQTVRNLRRSRQISRELADIDEALATYARIERQYHARPRLTPEQSVSLHVFELARGENGLQRAKLEGEREAVSRELELAVGHEIRLADDALAEPKTDWPPLPEDGTLPLAGSIVEAAKSGVSEAEAERRAAEAASWPDARLGPTFEVQRSPAQDFNAAGFNLALGLPLYQRNAAGRRRAALGVERAVLERDAALRETRDQRELALIRYRASAQALGRTVSEREVEKGHRETESLFDRGLVPVSLLMEAHRQRLDLIKTQDEAELSALEALCRLRAIQGRPYEVEP